MDMRVMNLKKSSEEVPVPLMVLQSEEDLLPDSLEKCCGLRCKKLATKAWPICSETPSYYCDDCVKLAKYSLSVSLGWADNRP